MSSEPTKVIFPCGPTMTQVSVALTRSSWRKSPKVWMAISGTAFRRITFRDFQARQLPELYHPLLVAGGA
jgi:hypothetical protein